MINNIILIIVIILLITLLIFIFCTLHISSKISIKEEYRRLDPKVLDDDTKDWNLEDIFTYNEEFVKKEDEDDLQGRKFI